VKATRWYRHHVSTTVSLHNLLMATEIMTSVMIRAVASQVGLPLTSSFLLEYSSENLNEYSSTGSTLIQAANDEEGSGLVSQRQYCYWQHCAKRRYLNNSEANFEVFCPTWVTRCTDGVKLSIGCKRLQPEMEICNRKQKLTSTRVAKNYSSSLLLE